MDIHELCERYARHPQVKALLRAVLNDRLRTLSVSGLLASSAPMAFAALSKSMREQRRTFLFILDDQEEAKMAWLRPAFRI